MRVLVPAAWLTGVLLCSLRLSAILLLAPFWQPLGLPVRVRALIVIALSATLVSSLRLMPASVPDSVPGLIAAAAHELAVGGLMAFGVFTAFGAFHVAGSALDMQIGFNIANVFDPVTRSQSPLLASLLTMTAVVLFFTLDAHHALLRGVAYSLERIPLGGPAPEPDTGRIAALLARQFGIVFTLGLALAAPVLFCLFFVELAMAILARNLQQLNVFVLAMPVKIVVGLGLFAALAPQLADTARRVFDTIFGFWEAVLP